MASTQVDRINGLTGSTAVKTPVYCATTANITLAGEQTIDGVTTSSSRVLVKDQTNPVQNGIYDTSSGAWTRSRDMNGPRDARNGTLVTVTDGTQYSDTIWVLQSASTEVDFGTTSITFEDYNTALTGDYLTAVVTDIADGDILEWNGTDFVNVPLFSRSYAWENNHTFEANAIIEGKTIQPTRSELTIASAVITVTSSVHTVDTEADAASDTLSTISGGSDGMDLYLSSANGTRVVILDTAGNISIDGASSISLTNTSMTVHLKYRAAINKWVVINRFTIASALTYIQRVSASTVAMATGTTTMPADDTIPQNTEGFEVITVSVTPTSATSKLIIEATVHHSHSVSNNFVGVALFQDSTANALAVAANHVPDNAVIKQTTLRHVMTSGTTSPTTFKIRIGSNQAGTVTINGIGGSRYYGGVLSSLINVTEVSA